MGRYLTAIKKEVRNSLPAVRRGNERREPPLVEVEPYYEERRPSQPYYDQGPPGEMTRSDFQAALEQARRQERDEMMARLDASHHAHADRMHSLAMAAINKKNDPLQIRYRGSAYDKKERTFGQLRFALLLGGVVLLLTFVFWVKDQVASQAGSSPQAWGPPAHQLPYKHYERHESWDGR